jgi:hypothetical protein
MLHVSKMPVINKRFENLSPNFTRSTLNAIITTVVMNELSQNNQ